MTAFLGCALSAQPPKAPLVAVEIYGSARVDFKRLREALPVKVGEDFDPREFSADKIDELKKLVGKNQRSVSPIYVMGDLKGWIIYLNVEPEDKAPLVWHPKPTGEAKLPEWIVGLYEHSMQRFASGGIQAGDDTSEGYSYSKDPEMRADQTKLIAYAREHAADVYGALANSSSDRDRIAAAWIAGYAPKDQTQLDTLLGAVHDSNSTVRNNSVRVLAVLAGYDKKIAARIPADPFIPMLASITWSDRNKAMAVLGPVTAAREPKTLEALRTQAMEPLRQMTGWKFWGHAAMAAVLLGRAGGIAEERLEELLKAKDASTILREATGR